ncbi:PQQ-binding-like beta-propeller repeat protein [Streptomyces sp. MBT62]|uniref:protein kinase domain-containing protein n=1 Tax=Streptomyces sp. MBT62 TaxID=2800410 RepID=UPI00190A46CC|nr:PQQ-binding-like beta-propeller repeat protein [Streptomyces sp. MBT62]MBK3568090.1 PQQ-binding-like beta-propeller repeat protein [Streptomyces sp. MBT62]
MSLHRGDAESVGGYVLGDRLGSGGMGVVYLGRSASGRQVAVKVVHAQYAQDEEFRARFRQEIAAARRVSGAFTAPVVDADPDAEVPWMATLYVPGRTLAEVVEKDGPLGGRALRTLALGLVEALRDIHQAGVVHRDLKPSNVLLAEDGPRVIDFGISRAADNQTLTMTGRLIGTPPFMSPEQFAAPRDVTAASDVFSLGSLLVYAATGNRPFDGASPYLTGYQVMHEQPRLDGVPEPLRTIAERCLDKEARARPRLTELQGMLLNLPESTTVADLPGAARPGPGTPATVRDGGRRPRRVRRLVITLATAVAVVALGLTTLHRMSDGKNSDTGASTSAASSAAVALPAGWRPWQASLLTAKTGDPLDELESGCVAGGGALVYCAGTGFTVTALDAASGRVTWRSGTSPETSRPVGVQDGRVFTYVKPDSTQTFVTRRLVALDAKTGTQLWEHPVSEDRNAVLFDGGILAMDENATKFVAYDTSGDRLWTAPAKSTAGDACTPAVLDGAPYGLCTPADDPTKGGVTLLHLNPADGTSKEIAQLPVGAQPLGVVDERLVFAVPKLAEGSFGSGEDQQYTTLEEVDPADGGRRIPLPGAARGTPTLLKGVIHFVRPNGTVTAVRASDGKQLWQRATEIENLSAPVLSTKSNTLYFTNRFGRLLALNARTGTVRWRTSALQNPGDSTDDTVPYALLVKDALVAVAGDTAFSVRTDRPVLPR